METAKISPLESLTIYGYVMCSDVCKVGVCASGMEKVIIHIILNILSMTKATTHLIALHSTIYYIAHYSR